MLDRLACTFFILAMMGFGIGALFWPPAMWLRLAIMIFAAAFVVCLLLDVWTN